MLKRVMLLLCILGGIGLTSQGVLAEVDCGTDNEKCKIESVKFEIPVSSITQMGTLGKTDAKEQSTPEAINSFLGIVIQKMMIALGIAALVIMVVGSAYMIFYGGNDTTLSKGKGMFTAGIIGLVVALSSYYLVSLISYIIYSAP